MSEATRTAETKKELYRQEIHNLRETVKELEGALHIRLAEQGERDSLRARVRELEEAMPTPKEILDIGVGNHSHEKWVMSINLADRIEKLMKR